MSRGARIGIVVLIQTLVLCGMVGMRQWTLATGTPVVLETQPVDPRSLFSGDYVRLGYTVSALRLDGLAGDKDFKRNDTVFVTLVPDGAFWKPVSVHRNRPDAPAGQVVLKGRVQYVAESIWDREANKMVDARHVQVTYGIEDYFVQEGTGRALERPPADEKVSIQVAVDRFGNAGIKAVLVNGQPRYTETLF
jgi:uncharacterized membrane-anchored protein